MLFKSAVTFQKVNKVETYLPWYLSARMKTKHPGHSAACFIQYLTILIMPVPASIHCHPQENLQVCTVYVKPKRKYANQLASISNTIFLPINLDASMFPNLHPQSIFLCKSLLLQVWVAWPVLFSYCRNLKQIAWEKRKDF